MTGHDDGSDLTALLLVDDDAIDALLDGDAVPEPVEHLGAFAALVRAVGDGPPPPASRDLAELLTAGRAGVASTLGTGSTGGRAARSPQRHSALAKVAGIGLATQLTLGASAAAAGVIGAGAAGVLPRPADTAVRHAIEVMTPLDFADPGRRGHDHPPGGAGASDADDPADGSGDGGTGTSHGGEDATGGRGGAEGGHGEPSDARPGASDDASDPSGEGGQPGDSARTADPGNGQPGQPADGTGGSDPATPQSGVPGSSDGSYDRER